MSESFLRKGTNGDRFWIDQNNRYHREGDLPAIEWANGDVEYYIHGENHREEGPALKRRGVASYWLFGHPCSQQEHTLYQESGALPNTWPGWWKDGVPLRNPGKLFGNMKVGPSK